MTTDPRRRPHADVPCSICHEVIDPASAYWVAVEGAWFDEDGWPFTVSDLEPVCEPCVSHLLSDRDPPRHALQRPRPADSIEE